MDKLTVSSYEQLKETLDAKKTQFSKIFILFTGSKKENGNSWCPDCVQAEPVIDEVAKKYQSGSALLVTTFVGPRDEWKNAENIFRKSEYAVRCIPTLVRYNTTNRLEDNQCKDSSTVEKFLKE